MAHLFYCRDANGKDLIFGNEKTGVLRFRNGFASIEDADPHVESIVAAVAAERYWQIEDLGSETDRVAPDAPGALVCDICGKAFRTDFALKGHLRSHAPKG